MAQKKKKREDRTWFQKGALSDGYQFGDVTKTILSSGADISENITAGVLGMGERVVDAGAYLLGGAGNILGADEFAQQMQGFIQKDLYDEKAIAQSIILGNAEHSVFGEKSDALMQSAGQLGATIGLQAAGVPWWVTTGVTSFGGEVENAFNEGASYGEAGLSAAISAGAEILTEKISGGISFGGKTLDDALTKSIARGVSNKVVRTLTKLGVDMVGEGAEEVLSGAMSAIGQKMTYADNKTLSELFSREDALESFIGGAVLGGGSGGIHAVRSTLKGRDYTSGLTANEETVVNKLLKDRMAEEAKKEDGKSESEVYDEIMDALDKGEISIDTIEEVLGGDSYKAYKDTVEREKEVIAELEGLYEGEELKREIMDFMEKESKRGEAQTKLSSEVFDLVKDSRLAESYYEVGRRRESFKADPSKYSEKQRRIVQKAIDSGVLNNTRRTHILVDTLSRIAEDKDVDFDFATNQKLKESGFAVEGADVNGYVVGNNITINMNSRKAWEFTVGHEITHVLEGTELYDGLRKALESYARGRKSKGGKFDNEYMERLYKVRQLYKGKDGYQGVDGFNNIKKEVIADLVGDYIFNDTDFIRHLSTKHRNIFEKIYDEIKYLAKVVTAGSEEARQIEKIKKAFEDAYRAEKNTATDAKPKLSFTDSDGADNGVKVLDGGTVTKYSLSTWTPETQTKVRENLVKAGYEEDRVDKWMKDTNGIASVIAADKDRLDFVATDNHTMLKNNQEYVKTLDASTLCAKRLTYQGTFDAIQHRLPNTVLSSDDLILLANMMKEHGVEAPCSVCYVESRRRHLGKFAQGWLDKYEGACKPNLDEVTTSDGLEALRKSHPDTYEDFMTAMKKKGSANPKVVQLRTEYRNEIMALTPAQIRKIEAIGGLRVQSFSDFETPHLLDMMQAVMDMTAKGLSSQAYTKVPNFAWVFGDTGIKINLSLIAEGNGFDADGNLVFSSIEGMNIDDAMKLRDTYSENVGTIIVGVNDKHILACMADDRIDFIIPFHRSGWGQKELEMMGMSSYSDYTYGQKEHSLETGEGVDNLYPPDYWDYSLSGKENAERYLNLCARTGREPKFSHFLVNNGDGSYSLQPDGSTDGYWKTLIDFKMYDNEGNGAPQKKVQPNFNMEEAHRVLSEYKGGANSLPVATDVVEEFVERYQNGTLYSANENIAPIGENVRYSLSDGDYLSAVERGDTETAQKMVDEAAKAAGYGVKVYHGTYDFGRTSFNAYDVLFTTDSEYTAKNFSNGAGKRPLSRDTIDAFTSPIDSVLEYVVNNTAWSDIERATIEDVDKVISKRSYTPEEIKKYNISKDSIEKNKKFVDELQEVKEAMKRGVPYFRDSSGFNSIGNIGGPNANIADEDWVRRIAYESTARKGQSGGTYELYASLGKTVVVDGQGDYYTSLTVPSALMSYARPDEINGASTDQIVRMAYDAGYDSVTFKDIREGGDYGNAGVSTVYAVFNPTRRIKSADPVTYDDDGKVIPLSERFNPKNEDIRYSLSDDIAPVGENATTTLPDDFAPVRSDIAPAEAEVPVETEAERYAKDVKRINKKFAADKAALDEEFAVKREQLADKDAFISGKAAELYKELRGLKKGVRASEELSYLLDHGYEWSSIRAALVNIRYTPDRLVNQNSTIEDIARKMLDDEYESSQYDLEEEYQERLEALETEAAKKRHEAKRITRKERYANIIDGFKKVFAEKGYDLDELLKNGKNLSTFATVDNTPQRVNEKTFGYKAGQILNDLTVNRVAQNETEGIKWLNTITGKKDGLLAQLSKEYGIKSGSKESAAAQMYAEGFYVDDNNDIIEYGDAELAADFPDASVQKRIKGLAGDARIRQFYDETLKAINESRTRNGYAEIPRLDNYFLHFRAMDDTFSRLGLPFNPNDIRAKDLPTDLNGVTADLKPGKPFFASEKHRMGKRTTHDILGGLERYATSAKNQIYHIDDIQNFRALRNYTADTFGQANGLSNLDAMSEEEAQQRIEEVFSSHLSNYAKFLNEEANILAGKTALIDRGLEGMLGRRAITFLKDLNGLVGRNMVGFNVSSSLTNFIPVAQTFAKTNKADFVKAFSQTVANKLRRGKLDNFAENSPVMIRRKGADVFYRTPVQKVADAGYTLMSAVDDISTELIARTKFNELTRKGMDEQKAHYETDKWVSRLMGDRSIGQMPQLYNSKMLGLITKFQLEVRNQLDSQFYDTIQEAKVSNEHIADAQTRNAKTAAKVASTFVQLAVAQHLFGKAFESVAGYNPAFDIIEVLMTTFGWDDDEDDEDTALDNIGEGFLALLEDLPYASVVMDGGRIPLSSALPVGQFISGTDKYGNEKSRVETVAEALPYLLPTGGYGQIKKTYQGLSMFDDDLPIAGSYTDSGNLRFPVEETPLNVAQAALFGQWASENAREYFDGEHNTLKENQIQELVDVDIPIREYWDYREGLAEQNTLEEKFDYIAGLDLPVAKKNILINNVVDRDEKVDLSNYDDFANFEEFDFAIKNPTKYAVAKASGGYASYKKHMDELKKIEADKNANGKSINGSRKKKVLKYINSIDADYGEKLIIYKHEYPADDTYNREIIEYLNNRNDISYEEMMVILQELGFIVSADGRVSWD